MNEKELPRWKIDYVRGYERNIWTNCQVLRPNSCWVLVICDEWWLGLYFLLSNHSKCWRKYWRERWAVVIIVREYAEQLFSQKISRRFHMWYPHLVWNRHSSFQLRMFLDCRETSHTFLVLSSSHSYMLRLSGKVECIQSSTGHSWQHDSNSLWSKSFLL